jgi:hypothetical protein
LIHSRLTESRDLSDIERLFNPFFLVLAQENAGDIVGARATAQQMLRPLETLARRTLITRLLRKRFRKFMLCLARRMQR